MIREILMYPKDKEILTKRSVETTAEDAKGLIQDLKDTLHNTENGVGISAVQIGDLRRVCVIHYNRKDIVLINPVITKTRGEVDSKEGCLSVPEKYGTFKRAQKVWIEYMDENGKFREIADGGFFSRVAQHELDHLDGWCEVFGLAGDEDEETRTK